jgi:hypothetical protein
MSAEARRSASRSSDFTASVAQDTERRRHELSKSNVMIERPSSATAPPAAP